MNRKAWLTVICVQLCFFAVTFLSFPVPSVLAVTFTVDNTGDDPDANPNDGRCETAGGSCTLRAAVQQANATGGADEIELEAAVYSLITPGTSENAAATGDLDVTGDLTIRGAGAGLTIINAGRLDRVFEVDPTRSGGVEVEIQGVTVQDGSLRDLGGAFLNNGSLLLSDTAVSGNTALDGDGGGIFNRGTVTLTRSLISANRATGDGGGIFNGNSLTTVNSTLSGNMATNGGAIENRGSISLQNTTIASNTATATGGILNRSALNLTSIQGTIVTENTGGNCSSALTSTGYNLGDTACGFTTSTDIDDIDALLCPLDNYGGPTHTHALQEGSGALDAGPPECPEVDQRGLPRPQDGDGGGGAECDIGAFESQTTAMECDPITPTPTPTRGVPTTTPTLTPTRVATAPPCVADCDADEQVEIDEVLRAVSIALGDALVTTCEEADRDGDGEVTVEELVAAVLVALGSCSGA